MLIYVLSDLLWQPDYTPRIEVGLPQINMDAPRLLAHCFLYELDSFLASDASRDFVRYMDDIDIGVDSIVEAKKVLRSVDLVLQTKQVRLNSGKTTILSRSDAVKHFRVFENARLDTVKSSINYQIKNNIPLDRARKLISLRIGREFKKKSFDTGNGEKILKRWLGLASLTKARISPKILEQLIKLRPSVRDNVYVLVRSQPLLPSVADALARSASSGLLVDDAAMVEMSNHLVETLVKTINCDVYIRKVIDSYDQKSYYGLHSKLWLQSKYGSTAELLKTLQDTENLWVPHDRLGRLAASFLPLFYNSPEEMSFKLLLNRTLNTGVREAYKFHLSLSSDPGTFTSMFNALKTPNFTRGTGITHAKYLCLLSALRNPNVSSGQKAVLINNNSLAFGDAYYRKIAKRLKLV
jgi:hypothetical protein